MAWEETDSDGCINIGLLISPFLAKAILWGLLLMPIIFIALFYPLYGFLFFLFFVGFGLTAFGAFIYPGYLHVTKKNAWKEFAASTGLNFVPGDFFNGASVYGNYRGYDLKAYSFLKGNMFLTFFAFFIKSLDDYGPYTRFVLSVNKAAEVIPIDKQFTAQDVIDLFKTAGLTRTALKGKIVASKNQPGLCYEQKGSETDKRYLQLILQTLGNWADTYSILLALGGEIIPILQKTLVICPDELQQIIVQLLYQIGQETIKNLGRPDSRRLCSACLARKSKANRSLWSNASLFGRF